MLIATLQVKPVLDAKLKFHMKAEYESRACRFKTPENLMMMVKISISFGFVWSGEPPTKPCFTPKTVPMSCVMAHLRVVQLGNVEINLSG